MGTNITGIGNANAIGFKSRVTGGIYFPPELKDALVGVWSAYGKSNDSTDRNIIKNKIKDRGGDFVISNAAFKLNSGFGKYEVDFTTWSKVAGTSIITDSKYVLTDEKAITNDGYFLWNRLAKDSFKVKISNIPNGGWMSYRYRITEEDTQLSSLFIREDGIYTLPATVAGSDVDFFISTASAPAKDWVGLTITQIPSFEGAFVTDGIDDLITSTKTVQDMLEGSNEITVVSMIGQLSTPNVNNYTNTIRNQPSTTGSYNKVEVSAIDKTGIYGYSFNSSLKCSIINDILGDKQDYSVPLTTQVENISAKYLVQGWIDINGLAVELSSVAWYWTFIANKVLTTDEINQVIAYFNLDRCVEPTVLYDVKRQGLSNDTPDSDWYLKDFSKNGFDMSLFNFAKKGNSGVGKYETDLSDTRIWTQSRDVTSSPFSSSYNGLSGWIIFANTELTNSADMPSFKIQVKGLLEGQELIYRYYDSTGQTNVYSMTKDGEYTLPSDVRTAKPLISNTSGFQVVKNDTNSITITQIPSHAGALCFDGVNDFGKVTGMPVYKDYTVVADYERTDIGNIEGIGTSPVLSKSYTAGQGSFIMNFIASTGNSIRSYSFGTGNTSNFNDLARQIFYQSKYKNQGFDITAGTGVDGDSLWLGTARDNDSRFFNGAIYSIMSFPYSMSEFLIERQLKKHKLGTLYPDMVEFRPIIKANDNYKIFYTAMLPLTGDIWERINIGDYVPVGRRVAIQLSFDNEASELVSAISSQLGNISITKNSNNKGYTIFGDILKNKSPQKINITIDEYIRYEDIVQPYPVLLRFKDENDN